MAPAPCHMPIEVVCVRVREHPHEERTPSGVVPWAVEERQSVQINKQYSQESEQMITTEGQLVSSDKGSMILLFNSTILQGDCHFVVDFFNFEQRIKNSPSQPLHRET